MEGRSLISSADRKNPGILVFYYLLYILIGVGAAIQVFPFVWTFLSALKPSSEIFKLSSSLLPRNYQWENFIKAWKSLPLARYLANSLIMCFGVCILQITISSLAAYSLSVLKPRFSKLILLLFVSTMMIPDEVLLIPLYTILQNFPFKHILLTKIEVPHLNLLNTYAGLILPYTAWGFAVFLLKGFFDSIPKDLFEAARVDGASELKIFLKIVLPLSKPVLSVLMVFTFMSVWEQFLLPMVVAPSDSMRTLMVGLEKLLEDQITPWNITLAAVTISTIPVLIVFLIFQKYIVKGITMTGLKG